MRLSIFAAMFALVLWGTPAFAGPGGTDTDGDGVLDNFDNCSLKMNPAQDDTDGDDCGNLCDADYTQDGLVQFSVVFGMTGHPLQQHVEPISAANVVAVNDFGYLSSAFGGGTGPSGTTAGTTACP